MASTYTGSAANASLASGVSIIVPSDGDPLNAASVDAGMQKNADYIEAIRTWLQGAAGLAVVILTNVANAIGLQSTGNGTGAGLKGIGGATGAPGVSAVAGAGNTRAALNVTPQAAPSAPADGDIWVETTTNVPKARINSSTKTILTSPIARTDEPAVGQQVSSSSGSFTTTSAALVDITNLTVTITTTGRPVILIMQPAGSTAAQLNMTVGGTLSNIAFDRGGATIANWKLINASAGSGNMSPSTLVWIDPVAAGTYTYKVRGNADGTNQLNVLNFVLAAYEL